MCNTQSKSYMREKSCYCCYRLKKHRFAKEIQGFMVTNIVVTVVLQKGKFVTMNEIKHEYVAEIQNAIWKAYKEVRETKSAIGFNDTVQALENKYSEVSKPMCDFISWLKCAWAPIINEIVGECQ